METPPGSQYGCYFLKYKPVDNHYVQQDANVKEQVFLAQHFAIVVECTISNIRCIANSSIIWCNMVFNFVNNYT